MTYLSLSLLHGRIRDCSLLVLVYTHIEPIKQLRAISSTMSMSMSMSEYGYENENESESESESGNETKKSHWTILLVYLYFMQQ